MNHIDAAKLYREQMANHVRREEENWHPLNRRARKKESEFWDGISLIVGTMAAFFLAATIIAQIFIRMGWVRP